MTPKPVILVGDVGGTSTDLAVADEKLTSRAIRTFASQEYASLIDIVREFLAAGAPRVSHAAFGIAGPVRDRSVRTTNLPWLVEAADLADALDVRDVLLINDIEAIGYGILRSTIVRSRYSILASHSQGTPL